MDETNMKSNIADQVILGTGVDVLPTLPMAVLPPSQSRKEQTGNVLSLHDAEMQLIKSGPAGMKRLASARALDMQELVPNLPDREAQMIGVGYTMLRMQGMTGALTNTTRAEVARLEAARNPPALGDDC